MSYGEVRGLIGGSTDGSRLNFHRKSVGSAPFYVVEGDTSFFRLPLFHAASCHVIM